MKPTLRSFFSSGAALRKHLGRGREREELRDRGQRSRGADRFEEGAARGVLRKHRPHHRGGDDAFVALVFALDRRALQAPARLACSCSIWLTMPAARAAGAVQPCFESKGLSNVDMSAPPSLALAGFWRDGSAMPVPCWSNLRSLNSSLAIRAARAHARGGARGGCQKFHHCRRINRRRSGAQVPASLRHDAVAADIDPRSLQRAIRLLHRKGRHWAPGLRSSRLPIS